MEFCATFLIGGLRGLDDGGTRVLFGHGLLPRSGAIPGENDDGSDDLHASAFGPCGIVQPLTAGEQQR